MKRIALKLEDKQSAVKSFSTIGTQIHGWGILCMWLCKHFFEHFNLLVQFRCKINITYCSDSAAKEGCLAAFLIFVLAASLLMWSYG